MGINSHVQLPNGILQYFRDETDPEKKVWYLDINTDEISRKAAKRLGTIKDYYSEDTEHFLSAEIESPITQLNAKVRRFCSGELSSISISEREVNDFKRYLQAAMVRSNIAMESLMEHSITAPYCTPQENHDDLIEVGMRCDGEIDPILNAYKMYILSNESSCNLVVPRNCFYMATAADIEHVIVVAPISPRAALVFAPINNDGFIKIIEDRSIQELNKCALRHEIMNHGEFLAANRQAELLELKEYYSANPEEMEDYSRCLDAEIKATIE